MSKPKLWIIAGCNGAGKSSFSKAFFKGNLIPFDYDQYFLKFYKKLQASDIQEKMAHNLAFEELQAQINQAILDKKDFCYETNFNSTPLHWPEKFKKNGYELHLIYFVLNSIEEAKRRVAIRVQNGGHFVPDTEIQMRYYAGFKNLDDHFAWFDSIDVYNCSYYKQEPKYCFSLVKGEVVLCEQFPEFLTALIPKIATKIEEGNQNL
ncbi:zeta toxin family protein [Algoriphagus mannitolivorans]|uniref:zeta toxin family protein n=1 Tax=Algoriphagus mannitolivorans TaxID=226504 RepID=UPI0004211FD6|nr:zeta toxin family protein [Algoriphagus mannitolivorans]